MLWESLILEFPYLIVPMIPSKGGLSKLKTEDNPEIKDWKVGLQWFCASLVWDPTLWNSDELS